MGKLERNLPNDAYEAATNANNPSASNPFITEVESAVGSASLLLYPTSAASAIPTYSKLVNTISDPDYDDPAVDSSTGVINATGQLIAEFASEEGIISGNPGIVNINTIGNIRRVSGTGTASFYFEVYHRDNLGTETLIGTSNTTGASSNPVYEQYFASCLINATNFGPTDRVVTKWYANRLPGGSDPTYEIQLGGATPVKITFPVPFVNLPSTVEELNDLTDVTTGLPGSPTNADDGRVLYYDVDTNQWISDDIANISNVVKDCKTSVLTGSIPKGTPVYLAGFDNDLLVVEACDAASAATMACIGVTAEALNDTDAKKVISFGKLQGIDTSTYSEGDELYVAAGGGFTTTRPTGTALIQRVAVILKSDNPGGQIKVFNTSRVAGLPNIAELSDWVGDSNGHPVERKNAYEPAIIGSSPDANTDETLGYRRGSMVFDYSTPGDIRLWMCLNAATGAAFWVVVNNNILRYWQNLSVGADSGYTWGTGGMVPLAGSSLKFVEGTNITLNTDPAMNAIRISATGVGGSSKFSRSVYMYNVIGASGTWNGVAVGATGATEFEDRWRVASFAGAGGADGFYCNVQLPNSYVAGADIKVTINISTLIDTGGDMYFAAGITQPTAGGGFGGSAETEWIGATVAVPANENFAAQIYTFDGTNMSPGDPLSIMVYRDPGNAADVTNQTSYISTLLIEEI